MVGNNNDESGVNLFLRDKSIICPTKERPNVAVATKEGVFVNLHLGEAMVLCVFGKRGDKIVLLEQRPTPQYGWGNTRWQALANDFSDCVAILVSGCGQTPRQVLGERGLQVVVLEGLISESVPHIFDGKEIPKALLKSPNVCGAGGCGSIDCKGNGHGCE